jgi:hypothetical protein
MILLSATYVPFFTASLLVGGTKALPHRRAKLSVQQTLDAAVLKN